MRLYKNAGTLFPTRDRASRRYHPY